LRVDWRKIEVRAGEARLRRGRLALRETLLPKLSG